MKALHSVTILTLALTTAAGAQLPRTGIESSDLFAALAIQPGETVGEIGAGNGELTIEAARLVGDSGRVLTSELGATRVAALRRSVQKSGLAHISVIAGDATTTNFPDACCDAIFMRNVYHHFADPSSMNASIFRSLKPGGRLAVIDFEPSRGRPEAIRPTDRDNDVSHGTTPATVARELTEAGFEVLQTDRGNERWFMVIARRVREPRKAGRDQPRK